MINEAEIGNIIKFDNYNYLVLEKLDFEEKKYIFTCKMENNEVTNEYFIFFLNGMYYVMLQDEDEINKVIKEFEKKLKRSVFTALKNLYEIGDAENDK